MIALLLATALATSPDQDGVIATANRVEPLPLTTEAVVPAASPATTVQSAAAHGLSTDQQISRWLESAAQAPAPYSLLEEPADDRRVHGSVTAGIGTHGYRGYGASVSVPIGENSRLDLHYRQTEGDYLGYRYGYGGYDYDPVTPFARDRRF